MKKITAILSLVFLVVFFGAACVVFYRAYDRLPETRFIIVALVLALIGAVSLLFRRFFIMGFLTAGSVLSWLAGSYVSKLNGSLAFYAALVVMGIVLLVFLIIGIVIEHGVQKQRRAAEDRRLEAEEIRAEAEAKARAQVREEAEAYTQRIPTMQSSDPIVSAPDLTLTSDLSFDFSDEGAEQP